MAHRGWCNMVQRNALAASWAVRVYSAEYQVPESMNRRSYPAGRFVVISKKSILVAFTLIGFAAGLAAQDKAQDKGADKKAWKSQAEYDLFAAAQKDANASNRLAELDKWKQQFAESDYADVRQQDR